MTTPAPISGKARRKSATVARPAQDSADVLLLTAQRLFAEKGIDAVSMREVAREAGQRNNSALHYHFGSKEALIQAILQRGVQKTDVLRNDYIDRMFMEQRHGDLRAVAEAIVWPLAIGIGTPQTDFHVRLLASAQMHPEIDLVAATREAAERGFGRVQDMLEQILPQVPPLVMRQRFLAGVAFVMFSLADFERIKMRRGKGQRSFDLQRAIENLIDMLCGALSAPVSPQVAQRLAEHEPVQPAAAARRAGSARNNS